MPTLNTRCVFEITQETMDDTDGILCRHGHPDNDQHFISGYKLNSTGL